METDHRHFYFEGKKFFPLIAENGNTQLLRIPYLAENKELEEILAQAQQIASQGKKILWELELPFSQKPLFIQDSSYFFSLGLWLKDLSQKLYTPLSEHTLGVILFKGTADFASYFLWTEQQEILFQERLAEQPSLSPKLSKFFFSADVLAEYFQRLCSFLPDSLLAFCLVDTSSLSLAETAYFAIKERFGHLLLGVTPTPLLIGHIKWEGSENQYSLKPTFTESLVAPLGLCLPPLETITDEHISKVSDTLSELNQNNKPVRILTETYLHESWDELDELIIFPDLISTQGKRKVQGFVAAGGSVIDNL